MKEKRFLSYEEYLMTPSNTPAIQKHLYKKFKETLKCKQTKKTTATTKTTCPSIAIPSFFRSEIRFNGFFFAVNISSIQPASHSSYELFDPSDLMVEQENHLAKKMSLKKLMPVISLYSYVYHFKSVTVSIANFTRDKNETRNNLSFYHSPSIENVRSNIALPFITRQLLYSIPYDLVYRLSLLILH
jgi:hypothetical protein